MDFKTIIYMRAVNIGNKGSIRMYCYHSYTKSINGVVYAPDRDAAKRKIHKLHKNIEFFR